MPRRSGHLSHMSQIIASKSELEKREFSLLAPYAVFSLKSRGRKFPETEDLTRAVFQRDRDRIVHSKPFRRLSGKTQVFVATYGDHFRDRLTHTLEVAQISRGIARNLRLNEDLCEAIALAHDIGHTPFGHAGEYALDEIMQSFGKSFEHNEQSRRIVENLEKQFPSFDGLNLSHEVLQGLAKHQTLYDQNSRKISGKTLEAQVVDIADEIAYQNHDIDDGLRSKLFDFRALSRLSLWREAFEEVIKKYGEGIDVVVMRHRTVSQLVSAMMQNVLETTAHNIHKYKIRTLDDVLAHGGNIVVFSQSFKKKAEQLREFLWRYMYRSTQVMRHSERGQRIIKDLFKHFYKNPRLMPKRFCEKINQQDPLEVIVKDYVAGCTDEYAEMLWNKC